MDERAKRIGENEVLFREVNERLLEVGEAFGAITGTAEFVCECGDASCAERLSIPLATYEQVRSDPTHFILVKGHEQSEFDKVVSGGDQFLIVEKRRGGPAEIAIKNDPRS